MYIINVSDVTHPYLEGSYETPGTAKDIFVKDTLAFIADGLSGLQIINVSNPSSPEFVSAYTIPDTNFTEYVSIQDSFAFLSVNCDDGYHWSQKSSFKIINISNPTFPLPVGSYDDTLWIHYIDFVVRDTLVYVGGGVWIFNVADPTNPFLVSSVQGVGGDIEIRDNYAFVSNRGLSVVDISDPFNTVYDTTYYPPHWSYSLCLSDTFIYILSDDHIEPDIFIYNISKPLEAKLLGSYITNRYVENVFVRDNYAYVADGYAGLKIVDVSNPKSPECIGWYDTPYLAHSVYVSDSFAYIADWTGFLVVDITNPASPESAAYLPTSDFALDIFVQDSFAYLAECSEGLTIYNISDPRNPCVVGSCPPKEATNGVFVRDSFAYLADGWQSFRIVDISNPYNPVPAGSCSTQDIAYDVWVSGNYAYVADNNSELTIIDVTDPYNPVYITSTGGGSPVYSKGRGVYVQGNYAYLAISSELSSKPYSLEIFDVSVPSNPILVDSYITPGGAYGIYVKDSLIYLADRLAFMIFSFNPTGVKETKKPLKKGLASSLRCIPNPCFDRAIIQYEIPKDEYGGISMYDCSGRLVRSFKDSESYKKEGYYEIVWNGRDNRGKKVSSGTYFCRMSSKKGSIERRGKIMLISQE